MEDFFVEEAAPVEQVGGLGWALSTPSVPWWLVIFKANEPRLQPAYRLLLPAKEQAWYDLSETRQVWLRAASNTGEG